MIHQKPLLRVTNAFEYPDTNHERISRFDTVGLMLISDIAEALLIDSVELGELSFHNFGSHIRVGVLQALRTSPLRASQPGVKISSRLVVAARVFGSRPVVAVSHNKDGEL